MASVSEKKAVYLEWSEAAVEAERKGDYAAAARAWQRAKLYATGRNYYWAKDRIEFCDRMMKKPFRGEE
ncbi:ANR family transcriptional regulator [Lonepinella sp. BR2474]|uniref:ANR family transcriptional regulator n=1 Tax=Lonepinella sp. BR2474 TaxID=3434548 RepID=UPI003F6E3729